MNMQQMKVGQKFNHDNMGFTVVGKGPCSPGLVLTQSFFYAKSDCGKWKIYFNY